MTVEGHLLHERTHNAEIRERRGKVLTVRGLNVSSSELGIAGVCDVVEFHEDERGVHVFGEDRLYTVVPVEYKRGKAKPDNIDEVQLAAQAMCLEQMLLCKITVGYIYYGEPRRREKVEICDGLRESVRQMLTEMHDLFARSHTPKVKPSKACKNCSLADICLPKLNKTKTVREYVQAYTEGE